MRSHRWVAGALCAGSLFIATGCGGGERQDANEKAATYDVSVNAAFPTQQRLATQEEMKITVRNDGQQTIPIVSVTLGETGPGGIEKALTQRSQQAGLADPEKPIWIVDEGPKGGDTSYVGTWALGALAAGKSRTFTWKLTAVIPGQHTVKYTVNAGLNGKAKAQLAGGGAPSGSFDVDVSDKPDQSTVDPDTGEVVTLKSGE